MSCHAILTQAFKAVVKVVWQNVGKRLITVSIGEAAVAVTDAIGYLDNKGSAAEKQVALRAFTIKMRKALHALVREAKSYLTALIL